MDPVSIETPVGVDPALRRGGDLEPLEQRRRHVKRHPRIAASLLPSFGLEVGSTRAREPDLHDINTVPTGPSGSGHGEWNPAPFRRRSDPPTGDPFIENPEGMKPLKRSEETCARCSCSHSC
jgi:hypothetical protein